MHRSARAALTAFASLLVAACADAGTPSAPESLAPTAPEARRTESDALSVYISGPTSITQEGVYEWTANASGGTGSYTYNWYVRPSWSTQWYWLTDGPTFTDDIGPGRGPETNTLRVDVTSGSESASDTHSFSVFTP